MRATINPHFRAYMDVVYNALNMGPYHASEVDEEADECAFDYPATVTEFRSFETTLHHATVEFESQIEKDLLLLSNPTFKAAKKQARLLEQILRDFTELSELFWNTPRYLVLYTQASEAQRLEWAYFALRHRLETDRPGDVAYIKQWLEFEEQEKARSYQGMKAPEGPLCCLLKMEYEEKKHTQQVIDEYYSFINSVTDTEIEGDTVALSRELARQCITTVQLKLWNRFAKLTSIDSAIPYIFDIDERQHLMDRQKGQPGRPLTFEESYILHQDRRADRFNEANGLKALDIEYTKKPHLALPGIDFSQVPPVVLAPSNSSAPNRPEDDPEMLRPRRRIVLLHFLREDLGEAISSDKAAGDLFRRYHDSGKNLDSQAHDAVTAWSDGSKIRKTSAIQVVNAVIKDLHYIKQYLTTEQQAQADQYIRALNDTRNRKQQ